MGREIKFRVWTGKKIVYIGNEKNDTAIWLEDGGNWVAVDHFTGSPKPIVDSRHNDAVLMQYTGLEDKNNNNIYEGDIITDYPGHRYVVVFVDGAFWCQYPNGEKFMPSVVWREVLGNIYEQPDLLIYLPSS